MTHLKKTLFKAYAATQFAATLGTCHLGAMSSKRLDRRRPRILFFPQTPPP
jgi:hypothetical protein